MTENRQPRVFYGYVVVAAAFLVMAVMWGTQYTFGVFFKPLLAEFGWTRAMTSGAFSLSLVLTGLLSIVTGRLTDRFGPRLVVTVCGCFLGLGFLLVSQVSAIWQLYLFYGVLVGVGMSGSFVPLASTVARWFVKRRGTVTGIAVSGLGVGTMIMPPIANWLISSYGWRTSYIVVGVAALVLVVLAAQVLKYDPKQVGQLPYGESELEVVASSQDTGFSLKEALRAWQFWVIGIAWLCFGLSLGAVLVHIVLHAIGLGISAASAALILAVIGGLSTVGRVVMGTASDRIGNKLALVICFALLPIMLFWLSAARESWMLYLFAVIFGFGYGGIAALASPIVAEQFGLSSLGVLLGCIMICVEGGSAIGPVVAGHIFDVTSDYNTAFLLFAVISVIGLMLILLLRPTRKEGRTDESGRSS